MDGPSMLFEGVGFWVKFEMRAAEIPDRLNESCERSQTEWF